MSQNDSKEARIISLHTPPFDHAAVWHGVCDGDQRAIAKLFDHYQSRINRLIWRLLGADGEHDDLVHEAFLQIVHSMEKLKDPLAMDVWLDRIVINTVRKEIRARRFRRRRIMVVDELPEPPNSVATPFDQVITKKFYQLLDCLSSDARLLLVLRFVEQYTLEEIAQRNGYSLATTKRKLTKAVRCFKNLVNRDPTFACLKEGSW